jgi:hypothetical protein
MSEVAPDIAAADPADVAVARMEARLRVLDGVDEIGLEILEVLRDEVVANPGLALAAATAYAGLSRAIRLSVMLALRTEEALRALRAGLFGPRVEAKAPPPREAAAAPVVRDRPDRDSDAESAEDRDEDRTEESDEEGFREPADREAPDVLDDDAAIERLAARLDGYIADEARDAPAEPPRPSAVARLCADLNLVPARLSRPRASLYGATSRAPLLVLANADPPPKPLRRALE